jgi:serine/threonine protein kinase
VAEEIIDGYKLVNCMMTGQTSQVWEVVEQASSRHFAMKLLLPEKLSDVDMRKAMTHEANVGKELAHQNIIRIHYVGRDRKNPYYVMEYFPAGSLKIRLIRKQYDFIRERIHSILKQCAIGLAYMNASGWVHRDVKPDNMLVNSAGEVKLIDFALAKRIEKPSFFSKLFRRKGRAQGTRSYMAPEQIRDLPLDGRADVYAFGASAYELVTNRPPFRGANNQDLLTKVLVEKPSSPKVYNQDLTDDFCDLVLRMLAKKKEDRPRDFHEVLMKLRTIKVYKTDTVQKAAGEA